MKNFEISDIEDVRRCLSQSGYRLFGVGGFPSTRSEIWPFSPSHTVISSNKTGEFDSVSRDVKVSVFPMKKRPVPYPVKKPFLLLSNKKVERLIREKSKDKTSGIYLYQPTPEAEAICRKNGWRMIANPAKLYKKLDNRLEFQKILEEAGIRKKFFWIKLASLSENIDNLFKKFGNKIVIQIPDEGGGRGTMFFEKRNKSSMLLKIRERLRAIKKDAEDPLLSVSPFVAGPAISITACITRKNGILSSYCQYQLIDIPELTRNKRDATGIFCGHDWSFSNKIPTLIHTKAQDMVEKIGFALKQRGALGIFGLDLMWDKKNNNLHPLEINLRLLGTFPTAVYVQLEKGEVPLVAFHILEFLKIPYMVPKPSVYRKDRERQGSHMILFNPLGRDAFCEKALRGGVYRLKRGRLKLIRLGFELKDIKEEGEFILTEGVPETGSVYRENGKLLKIIAKESVSKKDGRELNDFGKNIAKAVYKTLSLKPYGKK